MCRQCQRWSLSPLDERWEAIDEAERAYRDTKKRMATDNVGLARLHDGTDLIRIGAPLRPEFAAWRYGDSFGRRRRKHLFVAASAVIAGGGMVAGAAAGVAAIGGASLALSFLPQVALYGWTRFAQRSTRVTVVDNDGELVRVSRQGLSFAILHFRPLTSDEPGELLLGVMGSDRKKPAKSHTYTDARGRERTMENRGSELSGAAAMNALSKMLPGMNGLAGSPRRVRDAIAIVERTTSPYALLTRLSAEDRAQSNKRLTPRRPDVLLVSDLPPAVRLALEMSLHEETERRALEGELHELEQRWKEAEEIAAISDSLTLPLAATEKFGVLKDQADRSTNCEGD